MLTDADRERFWSKVDTSGHCWLWRAGLLRSGYGKFKFNRKTISAHRMSFLISNDAIPRGLCVLHKCDTKRCVRPSHLFLGTQMDNIMDRDKKGRQSRGDKHGLAIKPFRERGDAHWTRRMPERLARGDRQGLRLHPEARAYGLRNGHYTKPECTPRGVNAGLAKVNDQIVRAIRAEYSVGNISQQRLASKYGIVQSVISSIILKRTWRHVI
jgi:hypothetical protein